MALSLKPLVNVKALSKSATLVVQARIVLSFLLPVKKWSKLTAHVLGRKISVFSV